MMAFILLLCASVHRIQAYICKNNTKYYLYSRCPQYKRNRKVCQKVMGRRENLLYLATEHFNFLLTRDLAHPISHTLEICARYTFSRSVLTYQSIIYLYTVLFGECKKAISLIFLGLKKQYLVTSELKSMLQVAKLSEFIISVQIILAQFFHDYSLFRILYRLP